MKKMVLFFWYPDRKTVKVFRYGSYIFLAPFLVLSFILHTIIILDLLFLFFVLKAIVTLRSVLTSDIMEDYFEIYSIKTAKYGNLKKAYIVFGVMIVCFLSGVTFLFIKTGGIFGLYVAIFLATIILPPFFEKIILIRRYRPVGGR